MALVTQYALPFAHMVSLMGLMVLVVRAERRADRWEGHSRALAKRIILERTDNAKTRVMPPRWQ